MRAKLAEIYHWTFAAIDDMTLEQIDSAWRKGSRPKGIKAGSLEEALAIKKDMEMNWRRYYGI